MRLSAYLLLDHALLRQRAAEGDSGCRPFHHQVERPLSHPDAAHAVVDPARPEPRLGDHEAVALGGD